MRPCASCERAASARSARRRCAARAPARVGARAQRAVELLVLDRAGAVGVERVEEARPTARPGRGGRASAARGGISLRVTGLQSLSHSLKRSITRTAWVKRLADDDVAAGGVELDVAEDLRVGVGLEALLMWRRSVTLSADATVSATRSSSSELRCGCRCLSQPLPTKRFRKYERGGNERVERHEAPPVPRRDSKSFMTTQLRKEASPARCRPQNVCLATSLAEQVRAARAANEVKSRISAAETTAADARRPPPPLWQQRRPSSRRRPPTS